jgi:hypothetical protein
VETGEPVVWAEAKGRLGKRRAKATHQARGVAQEYTFTSSDGYAGILADWVPLRMKVQNQVVKKQTLSAPGNPTLEIQIHMDA